MKDFKEFRESSANKLERLVSDYFSADKRVRDKAIKTLKNIAQSKMKDQLAGLLLDHGAKLNDFQVIGLTEESSAPGTTTANIPNPAQTMQGPMGSTSAELDELEEQEVFMGNPVFDVPCEVYEKFRTGKNRYHKWNKYLDMEDEGCIQVYEYAKTKSPSSIILRNKIGAMIHVKPEKYM